MTYAKDTEVPADRSRAEIERTLQRYGARVKWPTHVGECWVWIGVIDSKGYGVASRSKTKKARAHRVFYEAFRGPIPEGLDIDHLCRLRACVNPAHMEPVTRRENVLRGEHPKVLAYWNGTCTRGHPMNGENLYISPGGQRQCRECRRRRDRERSR